MQKHLFYLFLLISLNNFILSSQNDMDSELESLLDESFKKYNQTFEAQKDFDMDSELNDLLKKSFEQYDNQQILDKIYQYNRNKINFELYNAIKYNKLDLAKKLLSSGAQITEDIRDLENEPMFVDDNECCTHLEHAIDNSNANMVELLFQNGVNPNIKPPQPCPITYNIIKSKKNCVKIVELFLKYKFDIHQPIDDGDENLVHVLDIALKKLEPDPYEEESDKIAAEERANDIINLLLNKYYEEYRLLAQAQQNLLNELPADLANIVPEYNNLAQYIKHIYEEKYGKKMPEEYIPKIIEFENAKIEELQQPKKKKHKISHENS